MQIAWKLVQNEQGYNYVCAVLREARREHLDPSELELQSVLNCHRWELNPGPLQEQQVLLTTEPPLQPPKNIF